MSWSNNAKEEDVEAWLYNLQAQTSGEGALKSWSYWNARPPGVQNQRFSMNPLACKKNKKQQTTKTLRLRSFPMIDTKAVAGMRLFDAISLKQKIFRQLICLTACTLIEQIEDLVLKWRTRYNFRSGLTNYYKNWYFVHNVQQIKRQCEATTEF